MRNLKVWIFILFLCTICILNNSVYASNITKYTYETEEVNETTDKFINIGTNYFNKPSTVYDFFDETGAYNVVYTSETNVYWATFDNEMNIVNTRKMPMIYDKSNTAGSYLDLTTNFGNAIYYNEHLFVIYGREHYASSVDQSMTEEELKNFLNYPTMAVVKYNKEGVEVARNELAGTDTNYFTDWSDGTYLPFFPNSGCSLAINNDGILACLYGKTQFDAHQMSTLFFIDTEDLRWVSNRYKASQEDRDKYLKPTGFFNTHSMFTRIIATEDNGFIFADSGDALKRGLTIGKIFEDINSNLDYKEYRSIHYREGSNETFGYNNTYCTPGNFIEVSDGYLFFGSIEKTLSRQYGDSINEPWNIFAQKYKKDMHNETSPQAIQVFTQEEERVTVGTQPPESIRHGNLYLNGNEVDYGIKWLTDLESSIVINLKAVKADNENIILLWEELPYSSTNGGSNTIDSKVGSNYYMIIDKDANILTPRTKINKDVSLTTEEKYVYRDNKVYWTSCTGWNTQITVNVLNLIDNPVKEIKTNVNELTMDKDSKRIVEVSIEPLDTTDDVSVSWSSNNEEVALVNETTGEITAIEAGNAIITCTVVASNNETTKTYTSNIPVTVTGPKHVKSIRLSETNFELTKGHKHNLSVTINPSDATDITNISWSSTNPNIATVDEKAGTVTAIKEGQSIISVTVDCYDSSGKLIRDFSKHLTVTVTEAKKVESITTSVESLKLNIGEISNLNVTYNPEDTTDIVTTTWSSSNPSVVSVDELTGQVTALVGGEAVITCTVVAKDDITTKTFTKDINVVVPEKRPVTKIDVNTKELTLEKNNTSLLTVNVTPNDTTDNVAITWSSLNKDIADVDKETGLVTAKSKGETIVTCIVVCSDETRTVTYTKDVKVTVTDNSNPEKPPMPPSYLKGDLDKNGIINGADASVALDIYNKDITTEDDILIGDMDNNGIINGTDASMILDIYNKVL